MSRSRVKRMTGVLLTVAATVISLAACGSSAGGASGSSLTPVTLRYTFVHTGVNAPWTYGVDKGYFKAEGIDLKLEEGKGSATTAQTVANGSDDFGLVDAGTFLELGSKTLDAKAVMSVLDSSPAAILSPASKPIATADELVGTKLALAPGSAMATLLPAVLDAAHITKSQFDLVSLQPSATLTALLGGRVDAVATSVLVGATLAAKGLKTHALLFSDAGVRTPGQYLVASTSLIKSKPDLVKRFVLAAQKSFAATIADPDAAAASFAAYYSADYTKERALAELKIMLPLFTSPGSTDPIGWMSTSDARSTLKLLQHYGDITDAKPVEDYLTNQYLSRDVKP